MGRRFVQDRNRSSLSFMQEISGGDSLQEESSTSEGVTQVIELETFAERLRAAATGLYAAAGRMEAPSWNYEDVSTRKDNAMLNRQVMQLSQQVQRKASRQNA